MIKPGKIKEWIEEIEQRPLAAPFIVRTLSARVIELDKINEELRVENLNLQSGKKIQEYERRIAELEYQIELLKRQINTGELSVTPVEQPSLLIYDSLGKVLVSDFSPAHLVAGHVFASIRHFEAPALDDIHLLTANAADELLYLFDSGRIRTQRTGELIHTPADALDWGQAGQIEMRSGERLIAIVPITEVPMLDGILQVSRKGYARFINQDYFSSFLSEKNIGRGIRAASDALFTLTPCRQDDVYVLATRAGYVSARQAGKLSITLQETIKFDMQDYLVGAFTIQPDQQLLIAAQNGEVYVQKNPWVDPADADGAKRRLLLAGARAGGVSLVGAAALSPGGWHFRLTADGRVLLGRLDGEAERRKTRPAAAPAETQKIIAFTPWQQSRVSENGKSI
ncbi:MAG: hypothetical protein AAGU05_06990 [Anaerolineaceae bacterium]